MVKIIKNWETIHFIAISKDKKITAKIELRLNHFEKTYCISSPREYELISLKGKCKIELALNIEAIKAAENYIKNNLN